MNNDYQGNYYQNDYQNNYYENPQNNRNSEDKGSIGWAVLGFFFPLIGLILFIVLRKDKPESSKKAGIGALIGFISSLVIPFIVFNVFNTAWGTIQNTITDRACEMEYGEEYKLIRDGNEYFCENERTGIRLELE